VYPDATGRADVIAGYWVYHDQLDVFTSHVERFLAE
jgi:hypothetical protein